MVIFNAWSNRHRNSGILSGSRYRSNQFKSAGILITRALNVNMGALAGAGSFPLRIFVSALPKFAACLGSTKARERRAQTATDERAPHLLIEFADSSTIF